MMYKSILSLVFAVVLFGPGMDLGFQSSAAGEDGLKGRPAIASKAWAIADRNTGELLAHENGEAPLKGASTVKIMAAHVILQLARERPEVLDEVVTFSAYAAGTRGSSAGIVAGESLSVKDCLYALLLPSGNDVGNALAEHFNDRFAPPEADMDLPPPETRVNFIAEMNRAARRLGLDSTRYFLPYSDGHYADGGSRLAGTSALDLLRLTHVALQEPLFRQVVSTAEFGCEVKSPDGGSRRLTWTNTNQLLDKGDYDGVKTGSGSVAGRCLVSSARRGDGGWIVVVLGAPSEEAVYEGSERLFQWAWRERGSPDSARGREKSGAVLPGASPVIEAIAFPTLQAAIDAVPRTGGMLRLPPGEFRIDEPLVIQHQDFRMEGAGTATHIVNTNEVGAPAIIVEADRTGQPEGRVVRGWRVMLGNFRVTGNENSGHGILARNINEILIQGVTVSYHGGDGIHLDDCYENPRVSGNMITYNKGSGLHLNGCHDIVVSANQLEENWDGITAVDSFNLCMTGNNLDDHLGDGVVLLNTRGSIISGNMIEQCSGTALVLDDDCYGISISSNVITQHAKGGIDLRDAHGITISGNSMPMCTGFAVRVGPGSARIAITGNSFADKYLGDGLYRYRKGTSPVHVEDSGGVILESTRDVAIVGNSFSGVRPKALTLIGDCERISFSGNVIVHSPSDHEQLTNSEVHGNTFNPAP